MELNWDSRSPNVVDGFASAELLIAKDRAGPVFVSRETDTMFILTAHLKGYKREYIEIEINEDGTRIAISGEKPVQEIVMEGWKVYKKEIEMKGFRKAFKIPDGVNLDKIKARFSEEESILTISMPKLVKGIRGIRVEEVKEEEEEVARESSESIQTIVNDLAEKETMQQEEYRKPEHEEIKESDQAVEKLSDGFEIVQQREFEELGPEKVEQGGSMVACPEEISGQEVRDLKEQATEKVIQEEESRTEEEKGLEEHDRSTETIESTKVVPDQVIQQEKAQVVENHTADEIPRVESKMQGQESETIELKEDKLDQIETSRPKQLPDQDQEAQGKEEIQKRENDIEEEVSGPVKLLEPPRTEEEKSLSDQATQASQSPEKSSKLCAPIIAGSAILVSIIVFVIHFIRTKNPPNKKKN